MIHYCSVKLLVAQLLTVCHIKSGFNAVTPPTEQFGKVVVCVARMEENSAEVAGSGVKVLQFEQNTAKITKSNERSRCQASFHWLLVGRCSFMCRPEIQMAESTIN